MGKSENKLIKNSKEALLQIQSDFLPMFSEKAGEVIRNVINVSPEKKVIELKGTDNPLILSHSDVIINDINNWYDRVNLFWFENRLFIDFLKTYHGTASPVFDQRFDWYPKELRVKLGVDSRD